MKKKVSKKGRAMKVMRAMRTMRTIRTIRIMRARGKMRAMRKTVLNISLLTIDCNSTLCQALQYIKYHLVGTGSELSNGLSVGYRAQICNQPDQLHH